MKSIIRAAVLATAIVLPVASFAQQDNAPVTRAQVRAQLAELSSAGYRPSATNAYYPADIQAAEKRVTANHAVDNSFGGSANASNAGHRADAQTPGLPAVYFGN